jgi:hypothetical protein
MGDYTTITVDSNFLSMALTVALQLKSSIPDNIRVNIKDMEIDPETGYLILTVQHEEETIN